MHTCSYCRTTFRAKRIQCPFCLEEDAKKLDYFTTENEPGYQVHVCRSCKSYIKIADFREFFGRESIPALDDLESLPLDIAAQNEDFHRSRLPSGGYKHFAFRLVKYGPSHANRRGRLFLF